MIDKVTVRNVEGVNWVLYDHFVELQQERNLLRELMERVVSPVCSFAEGEKCPYIGNEDWACKDCVLKEIQQLFDKLGGEGKYETT